MIRVCIAGNSGHAATVTRALPRLPQVEICGWCRAWPGEPMTEVLEDFEKLGLTPPEYPDYLTMIDALSPDVLVVDGLFCDHEEMTCQALARGIHVYCDKPLALTLTGLERVREAAQSSTALLWAMQTARFDPWFYTAKQLIDAGEIGEIRLLTAQKSYRLGQRAPFFRDRAQHGGLIPWVAIHGIDFIRFGQSRRLAKDLALDRPISHILPLMVRQRNRSTQLAVHRLKDPGPLQRIRSQTARLQIWRKTYFLQFTEILHAAIGIKREQTVNTVCVLGQSPVQLCHREQIGGKAAGKTLDALTSFVVRHRRMPILMLGGQAMKFPVRRDAHFSRQEIGQMFFQPG